MANEIYDNSWWGVAIDTTSSIQDSTEMLKCQFNLEDRVIEGGGTLEARKCLADAMHLIGIQDIQN